MTFTFNSSLATDLALVRFHIGDTDENGYYLEDETINALITIKGSVGAASLACIKYILSQLSKPDFKLDWMTVSGMEQARKGYEDLLRKKASEFGISPSGVTISATITQPYRADSLQDTDDTNYPNYHSEFEDE
jgi:hypothetical protein